MRPASLLAARTLTCCPITARQAISNVSKQPGTRIPSIRTLGTASSSGKSACETTTGSLSVSNMRRTWAITSETAGTSSSDIVTTSWLPAESSSTRMRRFRHGPQAGPYGYTTRHRLARHAQAHGPGRTQATPRTDMVADSSGVTRDTTRETPPMQSTPPAFATLYGTKGYHESRAKARLARPAKSCFVSPGARLRARGDA